MYIGGKKMGVIFKSERNRELENLLLTQYVWDFPEKKDLQKMPVEVGEYYPSRKVAKAMENFATNLFRKVCSEMGIAYQEVEDIFLEQNEQFFETTKELYKDPQFKETQGKFLKDICENLIVPQWNRVDKMVAEIKRWSPEEQAEALQLLVGKKIKITVEDI